MKNLKEKVAYLQGLTEGLNLSDGSKESKIIVSMIDVLGDLAHSIETIHASQDELEDYVESIDEDLYHLENEFHGVDDDYVEMECPHCHEIVEVDEDLITDDEPIEVTCPSCGEIVYDSDEDLYIDEETETAYQKKSKDCI